MLIYAHNPKCGYKILLIVNRGPENVMEVLHREPRRLNREPQRSVGLSLSVVPLFPSVALSFSLRLSVSLTVKIPAGSYLNLFSAVTSFQLSVLNGIAGRPSELKRFASMLSSAHP